MQTADWIVLSLMLLATLLVGVSLSRLVKSSSDMFAAGGQSPWWLSGLSAFMTMFSANTFVVWGGIAYQHGIVAVVINTCYGIAALLAGYTVAGRWKRLGIRTPAEYVERRFGRPALHFYTWFMMAFRIVGTGGALYAIATLMLAAIGGDQAARLGANLNVAIAVFALIVIGYTMVGGLWAVLVTDTLQFIILNLAVLVVIPLSLAGVGGIGSAISGLPEGFLSLTTSRYTWFFLVGWVAIHYFMIGAEWAFVQRYLCVPSPRDARKSSYLFGGLYLISPLIWLLPPMLWRIKSPIPEGADAAAITRLAETAYIVSCKAVLPVGMLGLMLAALFSATASMISSQLNVFSGVLTENIYRPLAKTDDDRKLVRAGRFFTCALGVVIAAIAIATPYLGGAAKLIISVTELMVTPLLAPVLASLFIRRIKTNAIWATVGLCFPIGLVGRFTDLLSDTPFANTTFTGVVLPVAIVLLLALRRSDGAPDVSSLVSVAESADDSSVPVSNPVPLKIVAGCLVFCGLLMLALIPLNTGHLVLMAGFGVAQLAIAAWIWTKTRVSR